jgi:hypothetical protein
VNFERFHISRGFTFFPGLPIFGRPLAEAGAYIEEVNLIKVFVGPAQGFAKA